MRAAFLMLLTLAVSACGDKQQGPPPSPLDKRGIQERSDKTHDSLKDEEERDKRRKEQ